ncbi:hypothetical protein BT96DRAFT_826986 [Gymnopus androsaceus JB14]|uniref:Ubiquitin-like domain-containing protein n=1 Tax=Gymnopus androsaceus JB14 TaxID=1447944 RepID=A0A6A4HB45_9AGAR|nr:hypothetical protein BT96DRAFT_826986 [Gymnopus androsaceus JB14]
MSQEPEDVKPKLNLNIMHEGNHCTVKVKPNMQFRKIFEAAEKKFNKQSGALKFTYEGRRIKQDETPADLEMEDGDQIDAFLEQVRIHSPSEFNSF